MNHLMEEHHRLFGLLLPECLKPKNHYAEHIPEEIANLGHSPSCFGPERHHKVVNAFRGQEVWSLRVGLRRSPVDEQPRPGGSFSSTTIVGKRNLHVTMISSMNSSNVWIDPLPPEQIHSNRNSARGLHIMNKVYENTSLNMGGGEKELDLLGQVCNDK